MEIKIFVLIALIMIFLVYKSYFKSYNDMRKVFKKLSKYLALRDSLIVKLLPEIDDETLKVEVAEKINERKEKFKLDQNSAIESDIELNASIKKFYEELERCTHNNDNEVVKGLFKACMNIEQTLKKLRNEYSLRVEIYNMAIVKNKRVSLKFIKMKPLNTYLTKKQ